MAPKPVGGGVVAQPRMQQAPPPVAKGPPKIQAKVPGTVAGSSPAPTKPAVPAQKAYQPPSVDVCAALKQHESNFQAAPKGVWDQAKAATGFGDPAFSDADKQKFVARGNENGSDSTKWALYSARSGEDRDKKIPEQFEALQNSCAKDAAIDASMKQPSQAAAAPPTDALDALSRKAAERCETPTKGWWDVMGNLQKQAGCEGDKTIGDHVANTRKDGL